jgi:hypothetical protein
MVAFLIHHFCVVDFLCVGSRLKKVGGASMSIRLNFVGVAAVASLLYSMAVMVAPVHAENLSLSDSTLEGIAAQGISVGGDSTISCSTASTSICLGTYEWNDNHQFDASVDKGAIVMDGNVQQNVTSEINLNQTQSSGANGANVLGNISLSNSTLTMTNSNNATSFLGGF